MNSDLEDGEISDPQESDDVYIPLERPSNYSTLVQSQPVIPEEAESEEEGLQLQSSTDSNSDCDINPKRQKLKPRLKLIPKYRFKKRNDVWCNAASEDGLTENLVKCDVSQIDRSRAVETYITRETSKRSFDDRTDPTVRPTKRKDFIHHYKYNDCEPRIILNTNYTSNDSEEDIAKDIANKLCEEKEDLVRLVVDVLGKAKALELFKETQKIEANGGILIMNHTRRRAPGGVFFYLVKSDPDITDEQKNEVFVNDRLKFKQEQKNKKKLKNEIIKQKIKASGAKRLTKLLNRGDLELQNAANKEPVEEVDVKNPPPSPATDCAKSSTDELDNQNNIEAAARNIVSYDDDDDCLDVRTDMELF